jgi:hypothetical protein
MMFRSIAEAFSEQYDGSRFTLAQAQFVESLAKALEALPEGASADVALDLLRHPDFASDDSRCADVKSILEAQCCSYGAEVGGIRAEDIAEFADQLLDAFAPDEFEACEPEVEILQVGKQC